MSDKIILGKIEGYGVISIKKHSWECEWYWGFGYLGNTKCHFDLDSLIGKEHDVTKIFTGCRINQNDWWILRDLAIQAYALKKVAEVYRHGGYQITRKGVTDVIQSLDKAKAINKDLEEVLDTLWLHIQESVLRGDTK